MSDRTLPELPKLTWTNTNNVKHTASTEDYELLILWKNSNLIWSVKERSNDLDIPLDTGSCSTLVAAKALAELALIKDFYNKLYTQSII